jgi:glycolate oxidase FAD binding subunit
MKDMLLPNTETEAADIIRDHGQASRALAIFGGNTRSGFGNRIKAEVSLSSRAITGIVAYNPAEMVMTVKAGTPVAEVEASLSAANQMMAFEPMNHRAIMGTAGEPTIGGVFAANVSGPRRFVAGAARDSLLGIRFINGQGEAIKAGGRVMKNVTGLDLVKLLAGSYGTLGFLTEVTFRVLPVPPAQTTLVISGLEDEAATYAMAAAMATSVEVSGAAHLPESVKSRFLDGSLRDGAATVLRLEGLAASVKARSQKLQQDPVAGNPRRDALCRQSSQTTLARLGRSVARPQTGGGPAAGGGDRRVLRLAGRVGLDADGGAAGSRAFAVLRQSGRWRSCDINTLGSAGRHYGV